MQLCHRGRLADVIIITTIISTTTTTTTAITSTVTTTSAASGTSTTTHQWVHWSSSDLTLYSSVFLLCTTYESVLTSSCEQETPATTCHSSRPQRPQSTASWPQQFHRAYTTTTRYHSGRSQRPHGHNSSTVPTPPQCSINIMTTLHTM